MNPDSYLNPDYIAGRATGTCCYVCVKRQGCPFDNTGRKCGKDHGTCTECDHWDTRGCILFQFDKKFLTLKQ